MSKQISLALKEHLAQRVTTLAVCLKLTRLDGVQYGFTTHVRPLTGISDGGGFTDAMTYKPMPGLMPSGIQSSAGMSVDNMEFTSVFRDDAITEDVVKSGILDHCMIELFIVNYKSVSQGKLMLKKGRVGEIRSRSDGSFTAELRGLVQSYSQEIRPLTSPTCRCVRLTEGNCGVDPTGNTLLGLPVKRTATVTTVTNRRLYASSDVSAYPAAYYRFGLVKFLSGNNAGIEREIKDNGSGMFSLFEALPFDIQAGDGMELTAGCDRRIETCADKFGAVVWFDGEPHVPGVENATRIIN